MDYRPSDSSGESLSSFEVVLSINKLGVSLCPICLSLSAVNNVMFLLYCIPCL